MKNYRKETPRSMPWPPDADGGANLGLRVEEIVRSEWSGERCPFCDHTEVLDLLNRAMDLFCEGQALLEVVARDLFRG
jgi:hypothetical protein